MASNISTGSRAILSASLLVALELFVATERLLKDIQAADSVSIALGIPQHLLDDIRGGKVTVTLDDVIHWITYFALKKQYPALHKYTSGSASGQVVSSLELLIRSGW